MTIFDLWSAHYGDISFFMSDDGEVYRVFPDGGMKPLRAGGGYGHPDVGLRAAPGERLETIARKWWAQRLRVKREGGAFP